MDHTQRNEYADSIAHWFCNKSTIDATEVSRRARLLFNAVGQAAFKAMIMRKIHSIQRGIAAHYAGREFLKKGIHPVKQKLIMSLYTRLVRDRVMPVIYQLIEAMVEPGAFVATVMQTEDIPLIVGPVTYDATAAVEDELLELVNRLKNEPGASADILRALNNGNFADLIAPTESSSDSDEPEPAVARVVVPAARLDRLPAPVIDLIEDEDMPDAEDDAFVADDEEEEGEMSSSSEEYEPAAPRKRGRRPGPAREFEPRNLGFGKRRRE